MQISSSFLQANMTSLDYTCMKTATLEHVRSIFPAISSSCAVSGVRLQWQLMAYQVFTAAFYLFTAGLPWKRVFLFNHFGCKTLHVSAHKVLHQSYCSQIWVTLAHLLQNTKRVLLTFINEDASQESLVLEWGDLLVISPLECAQPWTERLQRMWEKETAAIFVLGQRNMLCKCQWMLVICMLSFSLCAVVWTVLFFWEVFLFIPPVYASELTTFISATFLNKSAIWYKIAVSQVI